MTHTTIRFLALLTGMLLPLSGLLYSQNACNLTVSAGPDATLCEGASLTLDGNVSGGNNPTVVWSPALGLSNPNILNPVASPLVTTTYTLTASSTSDNLIVNGGFETGTLSPSTSSYNQVADPVAIATNAPNFYGILSVPQIVQAFGCQPDIGDYTMVIHGSTGVGVNFWCQTVNVTPNTDYKLSFKVFGIPYFFSPAPTIVMKVNGVNIGSLTAPNGLCAEANANFTWNSGAATTAEVCLANSTVAGLGSMCSVDDITMVECCEISDEVTITVVPNVEEFRTEIICPGDVVEVGGQTFGDAGTYEIVLDNYLGCDSIIQLTVEVAEIEPFIDLSNGLDCINNTAVLDGSLSNGSFGIQSYAWSTSNGQINSNPNSPSVTIGGPGTYTLIVTTSNGQITCSDALSIDVPIDTVAPQFVIDPPPTAGCQDTTIILTATPINVPGNAQISWSSPNGLILSGGNTYMPTVQGTGTYILSVTNPANGCLTLDSVQVQAGGDLPLVQLIEAPTLSCRDTQGLILVQVIQPQSGYTLLWTSPQGLILEGDTTLTPRIGRAGTYQLVITDLSSGCTNTLQVNITANEDIPTLTLPATDTLYCGTDSLALNAQVPAGFDQLAILWTTNDGQLLSGADQLLAWAGQAGTYLIVVTDTLSGCADSASILIVSDAERPAVQAGPDLFIGCGNSSVSPNTAGTAQGPDIRYLWTTPNGQISNDTLLQPVFTSGGVYILTVTNLLNGCTASDTLTVTQSGDLPILVLATPDTLTCLVTQVTINANITVTGTPEILWTGPAGGILSGSSSPNPVVTLPGWYLLTVTDLQNQCSRQDSVLVIQDITPPTALIDPPAEINCSTPLVVLNGAASGPAGQIQFSWSTPNGQILSGANSATPQVNAGGTYNLLVTHLGNGCTATASVVVVQDPDLPTISLSTPDTLTCLVSAVSLQATVGSAPAGSTFLWTTANGQILGDPTTLSITAGAPGTYAFTLTLPGGTCTATDLVEVLQDIAVPAVLVPEPAPLTCVLSQTNLQALPQQFNDPLLFNWIQPNGQIAGTGASQSAGTAGLWTLVWTVPGNGCRDSLSVPVTANLQPPIADAGPEQALDCGGGTVTLDAGNSSGQGPLSFDWATANGQILSGAGSATMQAGSAGSYWVVVTDAANGCTAADTVQVFNQGGTATYGFETGAPACRGDAASIVLLTPATGQGPWTMNITGLAGSYPPGQSAALPPGLWPVRITDGAGCITDTLVFIAEAPLLVLNAPSELNISSGNGQINLSTNIPPGDIASISWTPNTLIAPTANPLIWTTRTESDLLYQVTLTTVDGCVLTTSIQIRVQQFRRLYVPDAFSPNNVDGINDTFFPYSNIGGFDRVSSMRVYDRWGNELYYRADFPTGQAEYGWDGTFRGQRMDPGVYVWVIEVPIAEGTTRVYKGEVTLF